MEIWALSFFMLSQKHSLSVPLHHHLRYLRTRDSWWHSTGRCRGPDTGSPRFVFYPRPLPPTNWTTCDQSLPLWCFIFSVSALDQGFLFSKLGCCLWKRSSLSEVEGGPRTLPTQLPVSSPAWEAPHQKPREFELPCLRWRLMSLGVYQRIASARRVSQTGLENMAILF